MTSLVYDILGIGNVGFYIGLFADRLKFLVIGVDAGILLEGQMFLMLFNLTIDILETKQIIENLID